MMRFTITLALLPAIAFAAPVFNGPSSVSSGPFQPSQTKSFAVLPPHVTSSFMGADSGSDQHTTRVVGNSPPSATRSPVFRFGSGGHLEPRGGIHFPKITLPEIRVPKIDLPKIPLRIDIPEITIDGVSCAACENAREAIRQVIGPVVDSIAGTEIACKSIALGTTTLTGNPLAGEAAKAVCLNEAEQERAKRKAKADAKAAEQSDRRPKNGIFS